MAKKYWSVRPKITLPSTELQYSPESACLSSKQMPFVRFRR
jgi:hypothetical protein